MRYSTGSECASVFILQLDRTPNSSLYVCLHVRRSMWLCWSCILYIECSWAINTWRTASAAKGMTINVDFALAPHSRTSKRLTQLIGICGERFSSFSSTWMESHNWILCTTTAAKIWVKMGSELLMFQIVSKIHWFAQWTFAAGHHFTKLSHVRSKWTESKLPC